MSRTYKSSLEYRSNNAAATNSDIINAARKFFAAIVEQAIASASSPTEASAALKRCQEQVVAKAIQIAQASNQHPGDMETRVRDLLRTSNEKLRRGYPKDMIVIEAIAKAVGVWKTSPDEIVDPYEMWERVFSSAEDIAVFSHAHPGFWKRPERLMAQVSARARMMVTGHPTRIRRLIVLPDESAGAELNDLQELISVSTLRPSEKYVSSKFSNYLQLLDAFPIQTRWIRRGPFIELWGGKNSPRTYINTPPVSCIIWKDAATKTLKAVVWELNVDRVPLTCHTIKKPDDTQDLLGFFDSTFTLVSQGDKGGFEPVHLRPSRYTDAEINAGRLNSVP